MNDLVIIDQREVLGKDFRIYGDSNNPLFLAKDVAEWIEHSDVSTMLRTVDETEKLTQTLFVSGQNREMWFLTEDGLYEVLMQSRKPIAKEFKKQVKEILRSIRKHGAYMTPETISKVLLTPDFIIQLAQKLKDEQEQNKILSKKIEQDAPKVSFADAVSQSPTTILIGDLAKLLKQNGVDIGQNRLFEWLRKNNYLISRQGTSRNMPTQKAMDAGLLEITEHIFTNSHNGEPIIKKTPLVTGKGQLYFVNLFKSKSA